MQKPEDIIAPLIGLNRHRLATDGVGVTTLVTFHSCPLHCRYCLNPQCLVPEGVWRETTGGQLLDEVAVDNIYFLATGGGITFGGGEPLLRSDFIAAFCSLMPAQWNITLETSLNVDRHHLEQVLPYVSRFFVDIKDMNPVIYKAYTSRDNRRVIDHLQWLADQGATDKALIRLPLIPEYNTAADVDHSEQTLRQMGYENFDRFEYIQDVETYKKRK